MAQHIIDTTDDEYVDFVIFGEGDVPWLAVAFVEETGVVFYSNATDHAEAWQGGPNEIVEKAHELFREELEHYDSLQKQYPEHADEYDVDVQYEGSADPVFDDELVQRADA